MKQKLFSGCLFLLVSGQLFAGNPVEKSASAKFPSLKSVMTTEDGGSDFKMRHVVKLNLASLTFLNFSLQYELAFHKNMSGALGFYFIPERGLPTFGSTDTSMPEMTFSGYSITPEFRWYPGKKLEKPAPRGFYFAPYFRYTSWKIKTSMEVELPVPSSGSVPGLTLPADNIINADIKYSGYGVGLMIGAQWLIKDRISLDWWIMGGHYGAASLAFELSGEPMSYLLGFSEGQASMQKDLEESLGGDNLPFGTSKVEVTSTKAAVTVSDLPFVGFRAFGLTLGYAF